MYGKEITLPESSYGAMDARLGLLLARSSRIRRLGIFFQGFEMLISGVSKIAVIRYENVINFLKKNLAHTSIFL